MINNAAVFRSLLPTSWILWLAVGLGLFLAMIGVRCGVAWFSGLMLGFLGVSMGLSFYRYRCSELARTVPGLIPSQAMATIQLSLALMLIVGVSGIDTQTPFYSLSCCLLSLSLGLCVGIGLVWVFYLLCAVAILASTLYVFRFETLEILVAEVGTPGLGIVGIAMLLSGLWFGWYFWVRATANVEYEKPGAGFGAGSVAKASTAQKSGALYDGASENDLSLQLDTKRLRAGRRPVVGRLRKLLVARACLGPRDYVWSILFLLAVFGLLLYSRGRDELVTLYQYIYSMMVVCIPVTFFFSRFQTSFERMWLAGVADTRIQVVRRKIQMSAIGCVLVIVVGMLLLAIHTPVTSVTYAATGFLMLLALGMGGLLILLASRTYRWWIRHMTGVVLIMSILIVSTTFITLLLTEGNTDLLNSFVSKFGIGYCLVVGVAFATSCWGLCWVEGGRRLAQDSVLMETRWQL